MSQPQAVPAPAQLLQMIASKWVSNAIAAAAQFGIADLVAEGPRTIADMAAETKTHAPSLYRLLRALASVGVFTETEDGRFAQTALSEPLRSGVVPSMRDMAIMFNTTWHTGAWAEFPHSVRTGEPATRKVFGMEPFEWLSQHPEAAAVFNGAMTSMSQADGPPVAAAYDFSGFQHVVDVAGGMGMLLALILEKTPGLRGTLFEMPYFIDQVRNSPLLAPYRDRCDFVGGSFFESVPPADAYIMKHIIHDWYDDKASVILSTCRKAIAPGGKLLVVDQVVPGRNEPSLSKLMDLEMLALPGGMERTEEQFRTLFASAGFRLERIIPTAGPHSIVEGSPV